MPLVGIPLLPKHYLFTDEARLLLFLARFSEFFGIGTARAYKISSSFGYGVRKLDERGKHSG